MASSSCFGSAPGDLRTVDTRFPCGSPIRLTSLLKVTRWPIIQKVRSHTRVLLLLVRTRFQILFTPLTEVLFAFPSRYWFTIGHLLVFCLGGWSPLLQTGFLVSRSTLSHIMPLTYTWLSHSVVCLPMQFYSQHNTFGLLQFRSPLLPQSRLITFPRVTEMFHFSRFASSWYFTLIMMIHRCIGFPHSDITGASPLTGFPVLFAG